MGAVITITRKELAQRFRDRSFFIIGIAAPLILALIFDLILGNAVDDNASLTFDYGVVNEDDGQIGAAFDQMLAGMVEEGFVDLTTYEDEATAQEVVDDGDVDAVFIVPTGTSAAVQIGQAEIRVLGNVDSDIGAAVATSIANQFAARARTATIAAQAAVEVGAIGPADMGAAIADAAALDEPLDLETIEVQSRQVDTTTFFIAGLGIFFTFFIVGLSVTSMLDERSGGTLARLLAAPIRPAAIVAGKTLASIILGIVAMLFLMLASTLLMGAEWGNVFFAILLILATVFAAAGLMTFAGGLARSSEQAGNLQSIVALTMAMLGGTFVPITVESGILDTLRYMTPNAWFIRGLGDVAGEAYGDAMLAVFVLIGIGVVFGALGLFIVRRVVRL